MANSDQILKLLIGGVGLGLGQHAVSDEKIQIVRNLYLSGISEEFIAMQLDLEIPVVIQILKDLEVYREQ